jgi:hypothetical protein
MATKISSALGGGLIGAIALTLIHEGIKKIDSKTQTDSLGMNALSRILNGFNKETSSKNQEMFQLTPTGEILSNALYLSAVGIGSKKNILLRSALLGLTAGLGALVLPSYLGAEEKNHSNKSKLLTITRYLLGSFLTATTISAIEKANKKPKSVGKLLREHHTIVGN